MTQKRLARRISPRRSASEVAPPIRQSPRPLQGFGGTLDAPVTRVLASFDLWRYQWMVALERGPVQVCSGAPQGAPDGSERWMANEFYTLIVVPHAKARFRKFQVSVRLTRWVLGGLRRAGAGPGGHPDPLHLDRGRGRRGPAPAGREPGPRRPRRRPTRRTPGSSRPRCCSSRTSSPSWASWPGSSRACPTPRSAAWAASPERDDAPSVDIASTLKSLDDRWATLSEKSTRLEAYFKDQRELLASTPSIWPVRGYLSAGFGNRPRPLHRPARLPPGDRHLGRRSGTKVHAPADGVVVFSGDAGGLRQRPGASTTASGSSRATATWTASTSARARGSSAVT